MKICIIRHAYFPDCPTIRKEVRALIEGGHCVDVLCLRKQGQFKREKVLGAEVYRIPLRHKRKSIINYFTEYFVAFLMMSLLLISLYVQKRYDCVQVNTMPDFLVFSTLLPRLFGTKVLLHLHEPTPELWKTKYGARFCLLFNLQIKLEQWAIRYADHCLTVTKTLRNRFGEKGADTKKIIVIPNVCDEDVFNTPVPFESTEAKKDFILITHGLIEQRYGHEVVIRAVNLLRDTLPELRFYILGEGEYKSKIVALANELNCDDRVKFLGFVSQDELLKWLRCADVAVVAMERSPYSELIDTTKMYEYMALRKAVIISRLAALQEQFDDSCVKFFEPGNHQDLARCIVMLHANPQKRLELAENAYKHYDKLRWSRTKKIYLDVLESLLNR